MGKDNTINISEEAALALLRKRLLHLREKTDFFDTLFRTMGGYAVIATDFDSNIQTYNEKSLHCTGISMKRFLAGK